MWLSDSGAEPPEAGDGRLLRIPPGGGDAEVIELRPLNFPNGLAVAPDGAVFVIETFDTPGVVVYRDGDLSDHVSLPKTCPDGVAVAETGALYVSCYQPHTIFRVPPGGGEAEVVLDDWMGHFLLTPTNIVFTGDGLKTLVIASIGGWTIKAIDLDEAGAPLFYP
jgi:sugar lactone lactonase YvrE